MRSLLLLLVLVGCDGYMSPTPEAAPPERPTEVVVAADETPAPVEAMAAAVEETPAAPVCAPLEPEVDGRARCGLVTQTCGLSQDFGACRPMAGEWKLPETACSAEHFCTSCRPETDAAAVTLCGYDGAQAFKSCGDSEHTLLVGGQALEWLYDDTLAVSGHTFSCFR